MRTVGVFATVVAAAAAVGGVVLAVSSRKDLARYLKMRSM